MLTKKLLKTSLTNMLQTQNIYRISIRALCENAGINRSTFYKYYGSQFDLLSEMEQDLLVSTEEALAAAIRWAKPTERSLPAIMPSWIYKKQLEWRYVRWK